MVLDGNLKGAQYILRFKVLKDKKNKKTVLCQAYTLISFENEGLCAFAPNCQDSLRVMMVNKIPYVENLVDTFTKTLTGRVYVDDKDNIGFK